MLGKKSALLVIDAQNVYTSSESELYCRAADKTVANINKLIDAFEKRKAPIIYIRHVHKADGSDLGRMFDFTGEPSDFNFKEGTSEVEYDGALRKAPNAKEIVKNRYSAFAGTILHRTLQGLGVDHVMVCGFMTNFCCDATSKAAHDLDYFVTFVPDATGCPDLPSMKQDRIRQTVSALLENGFAVVKPTSEALD